MKIRSIKIIGSLVLILAVIAFFLYQNGYIGIHSINELTAKSTINPYNGVYHYDKSKIKSGKILESATIAEKNGYSLLTLSIDGPGASLLGYQFNSAIRNRFFTICLQDGFVVLNSGELGTSSSDYCKMPKTNTFSLKLKPISENILFCENCEEEDFPSYWIKN